MNLKKIDRCLCCNSTNLEKFFDLGETGLANSYLKDQTSFKTYPLSLSVCRECFHSQLGHAVNPDLLYKNYLYVSGTSKTLEEYFEWFVDYSSDYVGSLANSAVLEIACNDGSLLKKYQERGAFVTGVDPAENLRELSSAKGLDIITDYWNENCQKKLLKKFDIIIGQNVLAHMSYPKKFLELCKTSLNDNGTIFIQTSQANMIDNGEFDTIYHEHHSFFSARSFAHLLDQVGLYVRDINIVPIHGTSYLLAIGIGNTHCNKFIELQEKEERAGRYNIETYKLYSGKVQKIVDNFCELIIEEEKKGCKIVGFGAAAKGFTFQSLAKINVQYIMDDSPLKWHYYTPDASAQILPTDTILQETGKITVVIYAWNFFEEITNRINEKIKDNKNIDISYVTYFPELKYIKT